MNLDTFILKCQEHIHGEFDKLKCGDLYVETDRGKLRLEFSVFSKNSHVDKVTYTAPGVTIELRPMRGLDGEIDYQNVAVQLAFIIIIRWERRGQEIKRIEELVAQLETIRKAEVFYKWDLGVRPRVDVILDGSEMVLFSVFGSGIKYQPSRTALGGVYKRTGHELVAQSVAEIAAVPITEYEKLAERRCGSRRMDMFVSENVRYVCEEDDDFGWVLIGENRICPIKRIRPEKILCDLTQVIDDHPDFADLHLFTVGSVKTLVHTAEPMKGLIASADVTIHSKTDKDFALWFRVYDNAHVTCTCGMSDASRKAVQLIEDHMRPIQHS